MRLLPSRRVEGIRPDRFRPTHCPWPECSAHRTKRGYRCRKHGSYRRRSRPGIRIPRFLCKTCRRSFSRQTFATSYYLKRPELLVPIAAGLVAGSAHRQIARSLGCAGSTVTRLSARLGRHMLLLQALALAYLEGRLVEGVVLDHFETFVYSQDDRLGIGTTVGSDSWFVYTGEPAPHRRTGRRSPRKRAPRRPLPERVPGSVTRSVSRVLRLLHRLAPGGFRVISDDNPSYTAALAEDPRRAHVGHQVHRNPERGPGARRTAALERDRAMFPVDLLHKLWRHSEAHHRRETIAFGRRANAVLERTQVMIAWRNWIKGRSERTGDRTTPGMRVGLADRPQSWSDLLVRRLFPGRIELPEGWSEIYRRQWVTPAVGRNLRHELRHAF